MDGFQLQKFEISFLIYFRTFFPPKENRKRCSQVEPVEKLNFYPFFHPLLHTLELAPLHVRIQMFHKNWLECIINDIWGRNYSRRETEGETIVSLDEVPSPNNVRDSSRCLLVRFKSYWLPKVSRLLTLIQSIGGRRGGKKSISKQKNWYGVIYKFCKNFEWWWQKNR